ncbi:GAF domain-containing protein [Bradyrhizobium sp. 13971]
MVGRNRQIHVPDLDNLAPDLAEFPGLPHARAAGTRTMCGTPLRNRGKAIGSLIVHRDRLEPFSDDELLLLQSFADQAAIALEECALVQRDQGNAGAADRHCRHSEGHCVVTVRRTAGVRCHREQRQAAYRRLFDGGIPLR